MLSSTSHARRDARPTVLPRWARAADWFSIVCALLAIVVAVSGGFRTHVGALRITFTSPVRLLLAAIVVAVVRHALIRTTPIHVELVDRLRWWAREPAVRTAVAVLVGTRPAIML